MSQEVAKEVKTVIDRVLYLLDRYPHTRNDDRYLILLYLKRFCPKTSRMLPFIPYEVVKEEWPAFETITRARRKIQEQGLYPPTDPRVLKRRAKREKEFRKVMPKLEV